MAEKKPTEKEQEILVGDLGLKRYFEKIKKVLRKYMDMKERDYTIVSLWIIGTHLHKQFISYPYLYFNAMKSSGKSRILNLIKNLSWNGKMSGSLTEAGVFRNASKITLCADEFEMRDKGNESLKILFNSGYKKGLSVSRQEPVKGEKGKFADVEYELYCPISFANIYGLDNVLEDRCIPVILEKSSNKKITKKIELVEDDEFKEIKGGLKRLTENFKETLDYFGSIFREWNKYTDGEEVEEKYKKLFLKIDQTNLDSRNLELFFPMFIIADICGEKYLSEVIEISKEIVKERKEQDREENMDVKIFEFVKDLEIDQGFVLIAQLTREFREYHEIPETKRDEWINPRWMGRRLKTLRLRKESRRMPGGIEIIPDIAKAKEMWNKLFGENNKFKEELQGALDG